MWRGTASGARGSTVRVRRFQAPFVSRSEKTPGAAAPGFPGAHRARDANSGRPLVAIVSARTRSHYSAVADASVSVVVHLSLSRGAHQPPVTGHQTSISSWHVTTTLFDNFRSIIQQYIVFIY
jgi:hypothetical protein